MEETSVWEIVGAVVIVGTVLVIGAYRTFMKKDGLRQAIAGRPQARLAAVVVEPGRPFQLDYVVEQSAELRMFLEYELSSQHVSGSMTRGFTGRDGLAVKYELLEEGTPVASETVGRGFELPCPVDREITLAYSTRLRKHGSQYDRHGTMPIRSIAPRPAGTKLTLRGTLSLNDFTTASALTLFISTA